MARPALVGTSLFLGICGGSWATMHWLSRIDSRFETLTKVNIRIHRARETPAEMQETTCGVELREISASAPASRAASTAIPLLLVAILVTGGGLVSAASVRGWSTDPVERSLRAWPDTIRDGPSCSRFWR